MQPCLSFFPLTILRLLEGNEAGRVGRTDSGLTVTDGLV
jgi:hypothetical protein